MLTAAGEVDNDATPGALRLDRGRAGGGGRGHGGAERHDGGQVGAIRAALDEAAFADVAICAYSAKYASAF